MNQLRAVPIEHEQKGSGRSVFMKLWGTDRREHEHEGSGGSVFMNLWGTNPLEHEHEGAGGRVFMKPWGERIHACQAIQVMAMVYSLASWAAIPGNHYS